jgi:integrase
MADSGVYDRWHKTHPNPGEPRCREHRKVPSAAHGRGRRWQARWRDEAGQQQAKNFTQAADASRFLATVRVEVPGGSFIDPRAGRVLFRDVAEGWRVAQVHRPTTAAQVETHLRRHVYPALGDRALGSIRPSEIQAWVRRLEQDLAPSTIGVVYSFVAGIFRSAVRDRLVATSPCVDIRLPRPESRRVEPLATQRVEALIAAMPERYRTLVVLAAGTGLRHGEALGLEVETVDFLRRTLGVRQQLVTMPGRPPYLAPPKTPSSHRTIPLPQIVVDALAAHLAVFPVVEVELLDTTVKPEPRRRPARLVFTDATGLPIRRTRFSDIWRPAAAAAELGDGVTFHDLRHYYASLLIRHGESVKVVQKRLGHKSAVETLNTYSHLWPDSEDRTREAVDEVLGQAASRPFEEAAR